MYKVYKDHPIKDATHFNFNIYSSSLAKIILNKENETPFTIAINGKWGSGKTTLMKTLRNELDNSKPNPKSRKVKTVWFDAWKYSECDSMLAALVSEILEEMQRKKLLDNLKAKILVGAERVDVLKEMSDLAKMLTNGNGPEFEKWFRKTEYQNKLSFFDLFQDYMKTILQTFVLEKEDGEYTDSKGVLVVFIDDLDRCSPKNIANVLESINLFLDMEGCFFIIGTDISVISNAIDYQYQGVKNFSGIDYIKKMTQLNFDLPMLKEDDIQAFMKYELKIDSKLEPYFDIIVKGLKSNQREIIRFLNSLNLMRILGESLHGIGYEEELLLKWSVLNFSSADFIEEVKKKPNLLVKIQDISKIKTNSDKETYIQNLEDNQLKEKCNSFSENDKIISVLSHGTKEFNLESIGIYLFLSNIAPKEVKVEKDLLADEAIFEPGADLQGLDLRKYKMESVNLTGATLDNSDLMGVNLMRSKLVEATLVGAHLEGANLKNADLREANLAGAYMENADLSGANLRGAYLEDVDLKGASMRNANLKGAFMGDADLREADLTRANLIETNFERTNLEGAKLRGAKGLTFDQLSKVKTLYNAELDEELLSLKEKYPILFKDLEDE